MGLDQIIIAIMGSLAILLTQCKEERIYKRGCIVGIASQPFWYYASYEAAQWGIFFSSFLYTFAWFKGIKLHWIDPWINNRGGH